MWGWQPAAGHKLVAAAKAREAQLAAYLQLGVCDWSAAVEPLVIIQSHYDIRPRSLPHVSVEFRQLEALTRS